MIVYKSFKEQFRECLDLNLVKRVIDEKRPSLNQFWCKKYKVPCISDVCREDRSIYEWEDTSEIRN